MNFQLEPDIIVSRLAAYAIRFAGIATSPLGHKGHWHMARMIGDFSGVGGSCTIPLGTRSSFRFLLDDPYWSRLLCPTYSYEPEILRILHAAKPIGISFSDFGANFGYWSIFASDPEISASKVVAIEANPATFGHLEANRALNQDRFITLNRAVHYASDQTVYLDDNHDHSGIRVDGVVRQGKAIETICIDDLFQHFEPVGPPVIKLDVEGSEIPAFQGAQSVMSNDFLIIYEDHGADLASMTTGWLLDNTDFEIRHIDDANRSHAIRSVDHASVFKRKLSRGYNFFAFPRGSSFAPLFG